MSGQLSDDGHWRWNGVAWEAATKVAPIFDEDAPPGLFYIPDQKSGHMAYWTGSTWDKRSIAGIGTRIIAFLIDGFIYFLLYSGIVFALQAAGIPDDAPVYSIVLVGGVFVYFALWFGFLGRSFGQLVMGLHIVQIPTNGRLTWGASLLRALILFLNWLPVVTLILLVMTWSDRGGQGPQDKAVKDVVLVS